MRYTYFLLVRPSLTCKETWRRLGVAITEQKLDGPGLPRKNGDGSQEEANDISDAWEGIELT